MMISWFGLLLGIAVLCYALAESGDMTLLFNLHGFVIVIGGVMAAAMINSSAAELLAALRALKLVFTPKERGTNMDSLISRLVKLAQVARQEGFLGVQHELEPSDPPYLAIAVEMATVTGDPVRLRAVLESKAEVERHSRMESSNLFRTMGVFGPMFGLVGTIFGIVRVLQNMTNPESVGPAMALALTSALYGIIFSNLLCVPAANKIRSQALEIAVEEAVVIEAVATMASGVSPAVLETHLRTVYAQWLATPAPAGRAVPIAQS